MANIKNLLKMPWEYEFENEWTVNGFNLNEPVDRFFLYKATKKENQSGHINELEETEKFCAECFSKYGDIEDFDRCNLAIDLYRTLWGLGKRTGYYYPVKSNLFGEETLFGGETMNSVMIPLGKILTNLCQSEEGGKYEEERKYKKDDDKKGMINPTSTMYSLKLYQRYNKEFVTDICKKYGGFEAYVRAYHTLGNFVLVPAGFNGDRGTKLYLCKNEETPGYFQSKKDGKYYKKIDDFWDFSLKYLQENGYGDFTPEHFTEYINYFFLWDYVEKKNGKYEVKPIGMNNFSEKRDILKFLEESTENIKRRGIFMTAMLMLSQSDYQKLQSSIFGKSVVYQGFGDVISKVEEEISLDEPVKVILDRLKTEEE